jgi:hypothetical protein
MPDLDHATHCLAGRQAPTTGSLRTHPFTTTTGRRQKKNGRGRKSRESIGQEGKVGKRRRFEDKRMGRRGEDVKVRK